MSAITLQNDFFTCSKNGGELLSVRPGIEAEDALAAASALLDNVLGLLDSLSNEVCGNHLAEAAMCLTRVAKATIDAIDMSEERRPDAS